MEMPTSREGFGLAVQRFLHFKIKTDHGGSAAVWRSGDSATCMKASCWERAVATG